jgi:hypothetical protein
VRPRSAGLPREPGKTAPAPGGPGPLTPPPLIRPSLAEIRRLLARTLLAATRGIDHILHWSLFRRLHQTRALISHYHRRGDPLPMVGRNGERLDAWIDRVEADDQPDLHRFANGVRRDYEAVLNGLALEHSSGAVEGSVNRMKMIKRQMYGRAGFELLRKRVLLAS